MIKDSFILLLLTLLIYFIERKLKKKAFKLNRLGIDLFYVSTINIVYYFIYSFFFSYWSSLSFFKLDFTIWTFVIYFFVAEFLQYISHRIIHGDLLWRYHQVHHSAKDLSSISSFRYHPAIITFGSSFRLSILFLLGFPPSVFSIGRFTQDIVQIICHCDFHWNIGKLKYIFVTPQFHRTHHALDIERCNYGNILSLFDVIFRSYREPTQGEVYGVRNMNESWCIHIKKFLFLDLLEDLKKTIK